MAKSTSSWLSDIKSYHTSTMRWRRNARKIVDRYRLEREDMNLPSATSVRKSSFNILWSNVQTMKPALFARVPTIEAERRHNDRDPLGRIAAMVLERAANEEIERNGFFDSMSRVVLDVLLVGRGVPWVRFEADELPDVPVKRRLFGIDSGMAVPDDAAVEEDGDGITFDIGNGPAAAEARYLTEDGQMADPASVVDRKGQLTWTERGTINERVFLDYVHWTDFAHSPERTWADVERRGWVARRVALTRREGRERFGKDFDNVELTLSKRTTDRDDGSSLPETGNKYGEVWEIWDRESRKRIFVAKGLDQPLGEDPDPYGLVDFFPCPRPAYATLSNEDLVPTPDYMQYADLAEELNDISNRIRRITRALKLVGVYDASAEGLGKALTGGDFDGKMVPVTNFQALIGKSAGAGGGLNGAAQWIPVDHVVQALIGLYEARAQVKQTLYEVSGVSDIVRGEVDPREKASQSRIKAQFATARLDTRRRAVERVARDSARIMVELMAELYGAQSLREQSGFDLLRETAEDQMDPQVREQMWAGVIDLLENDKIRGFRIDVETDSTVEMDAGQTQEQRTEFLQSAGSFLGNALPLMEAAPEMAKPINEMLLFTVRSYRAGRTLESAFEEATEQIQEKIQQAQQQPPQPDPKAQAEAARVQQQMQVEGAKAQAELQRIGMRGQIEAAKGQAELAQAEAEHALDAEMSEQEIEQAMEKHALEIRKLQGQIAMQRAAAQAKAASARQPRAEA